jgi:hypothetical protein
MTPNDPSSSQRNTVLTITPGTAHGSSIRLRSHRRPGNARLSSSAVTRPIANAGAMVPARYASVTPTLCHVASLASTLR